MSEVKKALVALINQADDETIRDAVYATERSRKITRRLLTLTISGAPIKSIKKDLLESELTPTDIMRINKASAELLHELYKTTESLIIQRGGKTFPSKERRSLHKVIRAVQRTAENLTHRTRIDTKENQS